MANKPPNTYYWRPFKFFESSKRDSSNYCALKSPNSFCANKSIIIETKQSEVLSENMKHVYKMKLVYTKYNMIPRDKHQMEACSTIYIFLYCTRKPRHIHNRSTSVKLSRISSRTLIGQVVKLILFPFCANVRIIII